jgi:hypothetical protein
MRHPDRTKVATCNKNTRNIPIDGIWCSPGIEIEQAGMTSFEPTHIDTDHRMLWADFATNSLFGYRPPPLAPIIHAGVPLNDPEPVRIFNQQRLHKARQLQNIPNQIFWLEQRAINKIFDQDDALLYENILEIDDTLCEHDCKINLRKKYVGQVLYSDVIGKDRKELHLWNLILTRLQQRRVDTRKIRRLMHSTGQHRALQLNLPAALRAQKACKQLYKLQREGARSLFYEATPRTPDVFPIPCCYLL